MVEAWSIVGLDGWAGLTVAAAVVVLVVVLVRRGIVVRIRDERKGGRDDPC